MYPRLEKTLLLSRESKVGIKGYKGKLENDAGTEYYTKRS